MSLLGFPDGFVWGVATSAQQIEGARHEGGRGESVWDRYAAGAGNIEDASNADRTCDHYHRWAEDVELMRWLGVGAYRLSLAWPRILPTGAGTPNAAGLDFYDRLVDGLLAAGITPWITLNHWDLPQALMDRGGWVERDTVHRFVEYARAAGDRLGDRVRHWFTHNEPWCIATLGYEQGCHAPGHRSPAEALRAAHHLLLSHGLAVPELRRIVRDAQLGIVLNLSPGVAAADTPADHEAARIFDGFFNRWYLEPLYWGAYPDDAVADRVRWGHLAGPELPFVQDGDLAVIAAPTDLLGVNYYSRTVVKAGPNGDPVAAPPVPQSALTDMGWEVYPDGLVDMLRIVARDYAPAAIHVTENGVAYPDPAPAGGVIEDPRRVAFLRDHLAAAHAAVAEGIPLQGYFAWSLLDNFEWGHGYTKRFGLFGVDFATCRRTPKRSAHWYRAAVAANAVEAGPAPARRSP